MQHADETCGDEATPTQRAPAPETPGKPVSKILFLDGLRGLAAMCVVAYHAGYVREHNLGAPAVDVFFVLSAFLLTLIFEKKAKQLMEQRASRRRWGFALADYFARRFLRVYPLFFIVAVVLEVIPRNELARTMRLKDPATYSLPEILVFVQHPHVFWTLPVEISYYFFIPILVVVELHMRRFWWLLAIAGYALVFYNGIYMWNVRKNHVPWPQYPTLVCGSLAAMVYSRLDGFITKSGLQWNKFTTSLLRIVELSFLLLLLSKVFDGLLFKWIGRNPRPETNHFVAFDVTVVIVCEMLTPGSISSVLEWSLLRFAGKVSFSMYLLHSFIIYADFLRKWTYYEHFFLMWTLVFLLSTASFYAVEQPCQILAGRFGKWIKLKEVADKDRSDIEIAKTASAA